MLVCLVYDISESKTRTRVHHLCIQLGLTQIQRSTFSGRVQWRKLVDFKSQIEKLIDAAQDSLYIFPLLSDHADRNIIIGKAKSWALITGTETYIII